MSSMASGRGIPLARKDWDPMSEDYYDRKFNCYREGLGYDLQSNAKVGENMASHNVELFIAGLPPQLDEVALRSLFVQYGPVVKVTVPKSFYGPKNFGFVIMASFRGAQAAIENLHGFRIQESTLTVKVAQTKEEKEKRRKKREMESQFLIASKKNNEMGSYVSSDKENDAVHSSVEDGKGETKSSVQPSSLAVVGPAGDARKSPQSKMIVPVPVRSQVLQTGFGRGRVSLKNTDGWSLSSKAASNQDMLRCTYCSQRAASKCTRCKTRYCSKACQIKDWPEHKDKCEAIASELASSFGDGDELEVYVGEEILKLNRDIFSKLPEADKCESSGSSESPKSPQMGKGGQLKAQPKRLFEDDQRSLSRKSGLLLDTSDSDEYSHQQTGHRPHQSKNERLHQQTGCWAQSENNEHLHQQTDQSESNKRFHQRTGHRPHQPENNEHSGRQTAVLPHPCENYGSPHQEIEKVRAARSRPQGQNQRSHFDRKTSLQQWKEKPGAEKQFSAAQETHRDQKQERTPPEKPVQKKTAVCGSLKPTADQLTKGTSVLCTEKVDFPSDSTGQEVSVLSDGKKCQDMELGLKTGEPVQVLVAYVESPSSIWLQKVDHLLTLGDISSRLKGNLAGKERGRLEVKSNDMCASSYMGEWSRARVIKLLDRQRVSVFYVDFGNTEEVDISDLSPLPPEVAAYPPMAIQCCLNVSTVNKSPQWRSEVIEDVRQQCQYCKPFIATALAQKSYATIITLVRNEDGLDMAQYLIQKGWGKSLAEKVSLPGKQTHNTSPTSPLPAFPESPKRIFASKGKNVADDLEIGKTYRFLFMDCTDPLNFHMQVYDLERAKQFTVFALEMQQVYSAVSGEFYRPEVGELVVAKFSADEQWYRAEILEIQEAQARVLYVDYGNSETVALERVKAIQKEHSAIPFQSCHCAVAGVSAPTSKQWSPEQLQTFLYSITSYIEPLQDCAENKVCTAIVRAREAGVLWLDMVSSTQEQALSEILPPLLDQALLPQPLEPVSLLQSPHADSKLLSLAPSGSSPLELTPPVPERVTSPLAHISPPCSSSNYIASRSPSQQDIAGVSPPLFTQGDIPSALLPQNVVAECGLTEASGCLDFYAVTLDSMAELETLRGTLNTLANDAGTTSVCQKTQSGQLVLVQFSEDMEWYRGRVVSVSADGATCRVFFIDYGNAEEKAVSSLKTLPKAFWKIEAKAIHCCLARVNPPIPAEVDDILLKCKQMHVKLTALGIAGGKHVVEMMSLSGESVNDLVIARQNASRTESTLIPQSPNVPSRMASKPSPLPAKAMGSQMPDVGLQPKRRLTLASLSTTFPEEKEKEIMAMITYAVHPGHFFCQALTQAAFQVEMTQALKELSKEPPVTLAPEVGDLLCGKFEDGWYRCVVLKSLSENLCHVQFIDYGNESDVGLEDLRLLPESVLAFPLSTFRCALYGVMPIGEVWASQACRLLKALEQDHVTVGIQEATGGIFQVEVVYSQNDLADSLLQQGLAQKESDFLQQQIQEMQARLAKFKK